jgi:RNA polymerase sigma-70 factor (ECF subfamily)
MSNGLRSFKLCVRDADGPCVVAAEMIARAKWGDRDALGEIFREHHPAMLRYLRGVAIGQAEDVAGQVWVDVASSLRRFEGDNDDLRRWLFTIARRRMIDAFRSRSRHPEQSVAEAPTRVAAEGADASTERVGWAEDVLRRLPAAQAEVVMLRVILGFTVEEVAGLIDKSPGAVRVLAHRGLQNVSRLIADGRVSSTEDEENSRIGVTQGSPAAMERVR